MIVDGDKDIHISYVLLDSSGEFLSTNLNNIYVKTRKGIKRKEKGKCMNIINIYSLRENNKDVMVLKYILNCLGFYVRELNDFNSISSSLLDIYIIYDNNNDMLSFLKNKRMDKTNSLFIDRCNIIDCYKYDKIILFRTL